MIGLVQGGLDLEPLITHHLSIDNFGQGFHAMKAGQTRKVIQDWC